MKVHADVLKIQKRSVMKQGLLSVLREKTKMVNMLTNMDEIGAMGSIFRARLRAQARQARGYGITPAQLSLIRLARRRGPLRLSEAAAELDWAKPACTLVARACVERGWLNRRRSETDRRAARLELSGEGEELLDRLEGRSQSGPPLPDPLDILGSDERAALRSSLDKVRRRAIDLYGPEPAPEHGSLSNSLPPSKMVHGPDLHNPV